MVPGSPGAGYPGLAGVLFIVKKPDFFFPVVVLFQPGALFIAGDYMTSFHGLFKR